MRALVQRVSQARVDVGGETIGAIDHGLLVLVGVGPNDGPADCEKLAQKLLALRIFHDDEGKMNRSVVEVAGGLLVVSQFTLHADLRKGNRPSFADAAPPELAQRLYEDFLAALRAQYSGPIATGQFGADMQVALVNDGPVTLWMDTDQWLKKN